MNCDTRKFEVTLYPEDCKECGYCAEVCGLQVFKPADSFNEKGYRPMAVENGEKCVGCWACFYACPDFSIDVKMIE
ncbi:MAG: 4Fe-4S dicluster domain-containing protein [Proteobacteria bacterium]|nr:4Fe-4S dicluster domain-containing protein [Pseudomonadota bacterium]